MVEEAAEGSLLPNQAAVPRVGDAREDWTILRALSEILGKPLPYDSKKELRQRLADVAPHFGATDTVQLPMWLNGEYFKVGLAFSPLHAPHAPDR